MPLYRQPYLVRRQPGRPGRTVALAPVQLPVCPPVSVTARAAARRPGQPGLGSLLVRLGRLGLGRPAGHGISLRLQVKVPG